MSIFSSLLAIVATARLIPQDIEDRTVGTILAKPVPRFEYLLGKLFRRAAPPRHQRRHHERVVRGCSLRARTNCADETLRQMSKAPREQVDDALNAVRAAGLNIDILAGVAVIYLKACLLAALTLFVSTFATTSIFTVVVMVFVYFIGHLQATARDYWLEQQGAGWIARTFLAVIALIFPDLQAFNLVDEIVAGVAIPLALFAKAALLGIFNTAIYTLAATFVFYGKEL